MSARPPSQSALITDKRSAPTAVPILTSPRSSLLKSPLRELRWWSRKFREQNFLDYVFIHINKTGGSSIARALGLTGEHKTAMEKRRELGESAWSRRFRFTIVRNPWDKVVSHYHYRVATNQTSLGMNRVDFKEWVSLAYGDNLPAYYDNPKMFMPQWNWISNENGSLAVDFVGRFENLEQDFKSICRRINQDVLLPHKKKSKREHYRSYYDARAREIVRTWFKADIEEFDYEF